MIDREPEPGDGPEYHEDHRFWLWRQTHPIYEQLTLFPIDDYGK